MKEKLKREEISSNNDQELQKLRFDLTQKAQNIKNLKNYILIIRKNLLELDNNSSEDADPLDITKALKSKLEEKDQQIKQLQFLSLIHKRKIKSEEDKENILDNPGNHSMENK